MLSRRRLLQSGLYTAAGVTFGKRLPAFGQAMASPAPVRSGVKLAPYVDPLPIPRVIRSTDNPTEILELEAKGASRSPHYYGMGVQRFMAWAYNRGAERPISQY